LSAVELRGSARSYTISSESLDGLFFDLLVANEIVEVIRCEIRYRSAI